MATVSNLLQISDPQYWGAITQLPHLAKLGAFEPVYLSKMMDTVYEKNNGIDNFVSWVDRLPTETVTGINYRWKLMGQAERSIPCIKASTTATGSQVASTDRAGVNYTTFYMWFSERWFEAPSSLLGKNPEKYTLRIEEDPIMDGTGYRYKVKLWTSDETAYVPYADLAVGTLWSDSFAYVERDFSKRGNSVHHASWMEFENHFSTIRKQIEGPGSIIDAGKPNMPMAFKFIDPQTKKQMTTWIEKLLYDFYVQRRQDKALAYLFGTSNKDSDGNYHGKGESGNQIYTSHGLYKQMNLGNVGYYNNFSIDAFARYLMSLTVGKLNSDSSHFMVSTGSYGMLQVHQALSNKASQYPWIRSDHNFEKLANGTYNLNEAQIMGYTFVNGIKCTFMLDQNLDVHNVYKEVHPNGGLVSSYIYNIWDIGKQDGSSNIVKVSMGNEEILRYIPGMRHPFGKNVNNGMDLAVSSVDGWAAHYMADLSISIKNPLRTGRWLPTQMA